MAPISTSRKNIVASILAIVLAMPDVEVDYKFGAKVISGSGPLYKGGQAMTLGSFISGSKELKADPHNHVFQHEYGHYIQSQKMGWAYLGRVAIPSIFSAWFTPNIHAYRKYEMNANMEAFRYFNENVPGFYVSAEKYDPKKVTKGWSYLKNPLNKNREYVDYRTQMDEIRKNLSFRPSIFSYLFIPWL